MLVDLLIYEYLLYLQINVMMEWECTRILVHTESTLYYSVRVNKRVSYEIYEYMSIWSLIIVECPTFTIESMIMAIAQ